MTAGGVAVLIIVVWAAYMVLRGFWKAGKCVCNKCSDCNKRNFLG